MKNICIFQTGFIGDVICVFPLAVSIKKQVPNSKISIIIREGSENIANSCSAIDNIIVYRKKTSDKGFINSIKFINKLRKYKFDIFFLVHKSVRTSIIAKLSKVNKIIGFSNGSLKYLYTDIVEYKKEHEVFRILNMLRSVNLKKNFYGYSIIPSKNSLEFAEKYLDKLKINCIINPSSVWKTKCWPEKKYIKLCKELIKKNIKCILIGGPLDIELCNRIKNSLNSPYCINTAGKTTLEETSALIKLSDLMITNDSAPLHLGIAFSKPLIAIFGPTVKELGFFPFHKEGNIAEIKELNCRPCGMHGHNKCPEKHFLCMNLITVEDIIGKVSLILK